MDNQLSPSKILKKALQTWKKQFTNPALDVSESLISVPNNQSDVQIEIDLKHCIDLTPSAPTNRPANKVCFEYVPPTTPERTIRLKLIVPKNFLERAEIKFDDQPINMTVLEHCDQGEYIRLRETTLNEQNSVREKSNSSVPSLEHSGKSGKLSQRQQRPFPKMGIRSLYSQCNSNDSQIVQSLVMEKFRNVLHRLSQKTILANSNLLSSLLSSSEGIQTIEDTTTLNSSLKSVSLTEYLGDFQMDDDITGECDRTFTSDLGRFDSQDFLQAALGDYLDLSSSTIIPPPSHNNSSISTSNISCLLSSSMSIAHVNAIDTRRNGLIVKADAQLQIIRQTSKALAHCMENVEFCSTMQQVEAERILLLAARRREVLLDELQRVEYEEVDTNRGRVTVRDLTFFLRENKLYAKQVRMFVALVEQGTNVFATEAAVAEDGMIMFNVDGSFTDLASDFSIDISVFCLTLKKLNVIGERSKGMCPLMRRLGRKVILPHSEIRKSSFRLLGKATIAKRDLANVLNLRLKRTSRNAYIENYFNVMLDYDLN